jgi:peptidoglycan/xylan/chitin deacetylase (PgdA/CDA1 family)
MTQPTVALTVDLEPDCPPFLQGFRGVEQGLPVVLSLLDELEIPATFFTTGEVAERYPQSVRALVDAGHELGCHGMTHTAFTDLSREAAEHEIDRSAEILRAFAPVCSFRAPYLKFPEAYVELLEAARFDLDSSHARYKLANYRAKAATRLTRIPASITSSALRLPSMLARAYLRALSDPVVLFVHPWEFVDLRREKLRWDCRVRTGDAALACLRRVLEWYTRSGARFARMRELI